MSPFVYQDRQNTHMKVPTKSPHDDLFLVLPSITKSESLFARKLFPTYQVTRSVCPWPNIKSYAGSPSPVPPMLRTFNLPFSRSMIGRLLRNPSSYWLKRETWNLFLCYTTNSLLDFFIFLRHSQLCLAIFHFFSSMASNE